MAICRKNRRCLIASLIGSLTVTFLFITNSFRSASKVKELSQNVSIQIMIISDPINVQHRDNIRATWASSKRLKNLHPKVTIDSCFVINPSSDSLQRNILKTEHDYNSDMYFYDSESQDITLFHKVLQTNQKVNSHSHFLVVNDDVMVNMRKIVDLTMKHRAGNFIVGKKTNKTSFSSSALLFGGRGFADLLRDECFVVDAEEFLLKQKCTQRDVLLMHDSNVLPNIAYDETKKLCEVENFAVLGNMTLPKMKALQKELDYWKNDYNSVCRSGAMVFLLVAVAIFLITSVIVAMAIILCHICYKLISEGEESLIIRGSSIYSDINDEYW